MKENLTISLCVDVSPVSTSQWCNRRVCVRAYVWQCLVVVLESVLPFPNRQTLLLENFIPKWIFGGLVRKCPPFIWYYSSWGQELAFCVFLLSSHIAAGFSFQAKSAETLFFLSCCFLSKFPLLIFPFKVGFFLDVYQMMILLFSQNFFFVFI